MRKTDISVDKFAIFDIIAIDFTKSQSQMHTSADIYLLFRVAELARRFGMRPSEADASLNLVHKHDHDPGHFQLSFEGMTIDKQQNFDRMAKVLGCNDEGILESEDLSGLEDAVEKAMALAPRSRTP